MNIRCGIEINTRLADRVHILGYGLNWRDPGFVRRLEEFRSRREFRARRIVEALQKQGVPLSFEDVRAASRETLGRPHVADALIRKGWVKSRQEAFNRFLAQGRPGYVESMGPSPEEAISLIREAGGFASLAHPKTVGDLESLEGWMKQGLEGIEAYYALHSPSETARYAALAESRGLLATGGSDFHGPGSGRNRALGVAVPDRVFDRFMERLSRCA